MPAQVLEAILHPASVTDGSVHVIELPAAAAAAAEAAGVGTEAIVARLREAGILV